MTRLQGHPELWNPAQGAASTRADEFIRQRNLQMAALPVLDLTPLPSAPPPRRPDDLPVLNLHRCSQTGSAAGATDPEVCRRSDLSAARVAPAPEPSLSATVVPQQYPAAAAPSVTPVKGSSAVSSRAGVPRFAKAPEPCRVKPSPSIPTPRSSRSPRLVQRTGFWSRAPSPTIAAGLGGGAAGGAAGAAIGGVGAPVGALAGAALGVGTASLVQDLAPVYAQQIQAGKTHDEAVDYAWKHGIATGVITRPPPLFAGTVKTVRPRSVPVRLPAMPLSGAATRTGVPRRWASHCRVRGTMLPRLGHDVAAGAAVSPAGTRSVLERWKRCARRRRRRRSAEQMLRSRENAAREAFSPGGVPAANVRVVTPAPRPAFPQPGETSRLEVAPEQPVVSAAPAPPAGEPYAQTVVPAELPPWRQLRGSRQLLQSP